MNLLDILSTSPGYFCRKLIGQQMRIQILILGFKGLITAISVPSCLKWLKYSTINERELQASDLEPVDNAIGFRTTYPLDTNKLFKTLNGGLVNYYITTKNETYAIDFKGEPIRLIVPFAISQPIG